MLIPSLVLRIVIVGAIVAAAGVVSGQEFPNKPVRIVTSAIGGGNDFFVARLIAQWLAAGLGQQVIVDNRGGGVIPGEVVSKAAPDGYTLLYVSNTFWIGSLLRNTPYDPVKDFSPVMLVDRGPNVVVVHPSMPVRSVKELIALAKAKPGALNYGSGASGASSHLAPELFKAMAGVDIVRIPYQGVGPALNDLVGGQVQLMFPTAGSAAPYVKAGRLRAVAVTSVEPTVLAPGLPTVAASGLPGYESVSLDAAFVPANTPATIINRWNQEILRVINRPDVKEKLLGIGVEAVGSSPEELAVAIKSEMSRLGKVIKDVGIRAD